MLGWSVFGFTHSGKQDRILECQRELRKCPLIKPSVSNRCPPFKHLRCSVFTGVLEPTNQDNWKRFGVFPLAAAQEFVRHFLYGGVACRAPSLNAKVR